MVIHSTGDCSTVSMPSRTSRSMLVAGAAASRGELALRSNGIKHAAEIKKVIAFPPLFKKIKPSWVNTLSFLISIVDDQKVTDLVNWIISSEQEIVVKFEKDRISENLRITLFKQIFTYYKEKEILVELNSLNIF